MSTNFVAYIFALRRSLAWHYEALGRCQVVWQLPSSIDDDAMSLTILHGLRRIVPR